MTDDKTLPAGAAADESADGSTFESRLAELIDRLERSQRAFARAIEWPAGNVNNYTRGTSPPPDFIAAILTRYPRVSARWLLLGDGDMFVPDADREATAAEAFVALVQRYVEEGASDRGIEFDRLRIWFEDGAVRFDAAGRLRQ